MTHPNDEDDGQVDGDFSRPADFGFARSPYATRMTAQPWLSTGNPPWHLWGGAESKHIEIVAFDPDIDVVTVQLAKVSYKRPDTWKFILAAKLLQGAPAPLGNGVTITIQFDLIVGIGRAVVLMPAFQTLTINWANGQAAPINRLFMADSGTALRSLINGVSTTAEVDQLVAENIQCNARITAGGSFTTAIDLEVSAFFAPIVHVRPDWYLPEPLPLEQQFPGGETGGK